MRSPVRSAATCTGEAAPSITRSNAAVTSSAASDSPCASRRIARWTADYEAAASQPGYRTFAQRKKD